MLASVGPKPASAMKSVGDWPDVAMICLSREGSARSRWKPIATIDPNRSARKPPSNRLLPVVQIMTGSGTNP